MILIIAILAAIAIPVFLAQRQKGWDAQVQSALRNAAQAVEGYGVDNGGYGGLNANPQLATRLAEQGFLIPDWASDPGYLRVSGTSTRYCIEVRHRLHPTTNPWALATYQADMGSPQASPDVCPPL